MKVSINKRIGLGVTQPIKVSGFQNIDSWYGPWESLEKVNEEIQNLFLDEDDDDFGVITIAIWDDEDKTSVTEYWNPDASTNFVKKQNEINMEALTEELKKTFVYVEEVEGDETPEEDTPDYTTKDYVDSKIDELKSLHHLTDEDVQNIVDAHLSSKTLRIYCGGQLNANLADKLNSNFILNEDISVSRTLLFNNNKENVIDLNEHIIANANTDILYTEEGKSITSTVDAITVKPGTSLVINSNERVVTLKDNTKRYYIGKVTVVSGGGSTIYANGGKVVINGGLYHSLQGLKGGNGYSLIYADTNGEVEINGGYFIVNNEPSESNFQYVVNCKDNTDSIIKIKGGYFYQWNPVDHDARTKRPNYPEVILGDDFTNETYTVEVLEDTTFYGKTGTWYHVIPKA